MSRVTASSDMGRAEDRIVSWLGDLQRVRSKLEQIRASISSTPQEFSDMLTEVAGYDAGTTHATEQDLIARRTDLISEYAEILGEVDSLRAWMNDNITRF